MIQSQFKKIKTFFEEKDKARLKEGNLPYEYTNKGVWAGALPNVIFQLCKKIQLDKYDSFVDLGSGDGRVVFLAELFTSATGVESDENLFTLSQNNKEELKSKANFTHKDFFELTLTKFDIVFMNPDQPFTLATEKKLIKECKGKIFMYNNLFLPKLLKQKEVFVFDDIPVIEYGV
tara:strand:- start:4212 stop:4739 length:528 start_codon:yes stop_codon:yes gene_type:complete